jgi:hypothetical protein
MWLHAWNCWLMHTRKMNEEEKADAHGDSRPASASTRKKAPGAMAGLNTWGAGGISR